MLLVTSDTHRGDFIGAAARPAGVLTPNLDRLAARGVTFQDCWASTNVTNPSHIALMTGESPRDTGVHDNRTQLADAAPTLAESFRDLGYRTWAALSSRHLRHEVSGLGQGFDRVAAPFPTETRRAGDTLAVVDGWLAEADGSPVFLWVHLFDAHTPYDPPAEHAELYWPPAKDPMDPSLPDPGLPEDLLAPAKLQGLRDLDYPIAQYKGEVSYLDAQLGGLLERQPFVDGVVAFVADHGESLGEHRIFYGHSGLYPQTIHVPLILSWPDGPRGERQMDPVQQIDVSRTLLDLVGAEALPFPGRSLLESRRVDGGDGKSAARFALSAHGLEASVTLDGHHLLLELRNHQELSDLDRSEKHAFRMYDLVQDPECRVDIAGADPARAKSLHGILVEWLQSPKDLGWAGETSEDPELLAALEELGYATGPRDPGGRGAVGRRRLRVVPEAALTAASGGSGDREQPFQCGADARALGGRRDLDQELLEARVRHAALDERPALGAEQRLADLGALGRAEQASDAGLEVRHVVVGLHLQQPVDGGHELDQLVDGALALAIVHGGEGAHGLEVVDLRVLRLLQPVGVEDVARQRVERVVLLEGLDVVALRQPLDRGRQQQHRAGALAQHEARRLGLRPEPGGLEAQRRVDPLAHARGTGSCA